MRRDSWCQKASPRGRRLSDEREREREHCFIVESYRRQRSAPLYRFFSPNWEWRKGL